MADIDPADRPDRFARLNTRWVRIAGALAVVVAAAVVIPTLTSEPNTDETAIRTSDGDATGGGITVDQDAIDAGIEIPADGTVAPPATDRDEDEDEDEGRRTDGGKGSTTTTVRGSSTSSIDAPGTTTPTGGNPPGASSTSTTSSAAEPTTTTTVRCTADAAAANSITTSLSSTRSTAGLPALVRSGALDDIAQDWACKMATDGMSHNPNYVRQVFAACGGCTGVAENVGFNSNADAAWTAWMNSTTHRNNILDARAGKHGVGAARSASGQLFVVHDFGWD